MALPTVLPMILTTVLPMPLPTALPIVFHLVLTHDTTLDTTLGTTHGTTNDTTHGTTSRSSSCTVLPYPDTSLPFHLHFITGINFTYHPLLYHNHYAWIKMILPLLKLLISSFHLKYSFLFSHYDTDNFCLFAVHLPFVQSVIPSWHIFTHLVSSDILRNNVSCSRSFLNISPYQLHSHSSFPRQHTSLFFPNSSTWLSSVITRSHFSLFTTKDIIDVYSISPTPTLYHHPRFKGFIQ